MEYYPDTSQQPEHRDQLKDRLEEISNQYAVNAEITPTQARIGEWMCNIYKFLYYMRGILTFFLVIACIPGTYWGVKVLTGDTLLAVLSAPFSFAIPFCLWVFIEAILRTLQEYIFFYTDKLPEVNIQDTPYYQPPQESTKSKRKRAEAEMNRLDRAS